MCRPLQCQMKSHSVHSDYHLVISFTDSVFCDNDQDAHVTVVWQVTFRGDIPAPDGPGAPTFAAAAKRLALPLPLPLPLPRPLPPVAAAFLASASAFRFSASAKSNAVFCCRYFTIEVEKELFPKCSRLSNLFFHQPAPPDFSSFRRWDIPPSCRCTNQEQWNEHEKWWVLGSLGKSSLLPSIVLCTFDRRNVNIVVIQPERNEDISKKQKPQMQEKQLFQWNTVSANLNTK